MIVLGKKYKDSISGYVGIATARTVYLYGCIRILLESKKLKEDGTPQEVWFDEQRLVPKAKTKKEPNIYSVRTVAIPSKPVMLSLYFFPNSIIIFPFYVC